MEGENLILEELLHKIHDIKIGDFVDASDFLLKILTPTKPGEQDLLEDLRTGFRSKVIEPCFSKLGDIFHDLEKRHNAKDAQIYQLLDPLNPTDLQNYQQQVAGILEQNIKTLKYPKPSPLVSKLLADPLQLVKLTSQYQKKAADIINQQTKEMDDLRSPTISQENGNIPHFGSKNTKDVIPVSQKPAETAGLEAAPQEKSQTDLNKASWSISPTNNLLENAPKEKQQANLENEAIEITLSNKSLKDLQALLHQVDKGYKNNIVTQKEKSTEQNLPALELGGLLPLFKLLGKAALVGAVAKGAYEVGKEIGDYVVKKNKEADDARHEDQQHRENMSWVGGRPNDPKIAGDFIEHYKDFDFKSNEKAIELAEAQALVDLSRLDYLGYKNQLNEIDNLKIWRKAAMDAQDPNSARYKKAIEKRKQKVKEAEPQAAAKNQQFPATPQSNNIPEEIIVEPQTETIDDPVPVLPSIKPITTAPNKEYKVAPVSKSEPSPELISKVDLGDITKQFHQVLSPLFNKLHGALVEINKNSSSGDNIVNNINSTQTTPNNTIGVLQGGRDPIADFRSNYWRDASASTRYT